MKSLLVFSMASIFLGVSSCATMLTNHTKQKVQFRNSINGATLTIDNQSYKSDTTIIKLRKGQLHIATLSKEGYHSRDTLILQNKFNPVSLLSLSSGAALFFFPKLAIGVGLASFGFDAISKDGMNFPKNFDLPKLTPIPFRDSTQKFIWTANTNILVHQGDTTGILYNKPHKKNWGKAHKTWVADDNFYYTGTDLSVDLNNILNNYKFSNATDELVPNSWNSFYLNATIGKIKTHILDYSAAFAVMILEAEITWEVSDGYGNLVYTKSTNQNSDPVLIEKNAESEYYRKNNFNQKVEKAINSVLEFSVIELIQSDTMQSALKIKADYHEYASKTDLILKKDKIPTSINLEENLTSVVKIFSKNDHSSGTIITENGYIITNYDISTRDDKIIVKMDGSEYEAQKIATNEKFNLTLLKIEANNLQPITIQSENQFNLYDVVYALNFSSIEYLDGYASKGIVSSIRVVDGKQFIQTDVPLSDGNPGGLLVDVNGSAIGILSSKYNSTYIEGIGFAIPIEDCFEALKIPWR